MPSAEAPGEDSEGCAVGGGISHTETKVVGVPGGGPVSVLVRVVKRGVVVVPVREAVVAVLVAEIVREDVVAEVVVVGTAAVLVVAGIGVVAAGAARTTTLLHLERVTSVTALDVSTARILKNLNSGPTP
mmetsp:Transcript_139854/g.363554  ORF Transcript_139854/g.363554 Transcript_139854/m.363554 type:complete len:130 (-) Transcript_139854:357-746(-)